MTPSTGHTFSAMRHRAKTPSAFSPTVHTVRGVTWLCPRLAIAEPR